MTRVSLLVRKSCPWISGGSEPGWKKTASAVKSAGLVAGVAVLGCSLGKLLMTSYRELAVSVVGSSASLFLAMADPLYGLVIAIIAYPISVHYATLDLGASIPNISPDRLVVAFVLALMFLRATCRGRRYRYPQVCWVGLIFVVFYSLSFRNGYWSFFQSAQFLLDKWMLPLATYFILSNLVVDRRKLDIVLNLLLVLGVYSALYMMYEQATGNILIEVRETATFYKGTNLRIVRGMYGTTTTFGNIFNLLIPIALYYFLRARTVGRKTWYILVFVMMLVGIFFTYKRAVWLGMLLNLLIVQMFYPRFRKLFVVILLVSLVAIAAAWDKVSTSEAVTVRITDTDDWEDANGRTQRWEAGMEFWRANPIFGSGFRCYQEGPYFQTENLYIHLLASAGLVAFVPFIVMLLIVLGYSIAIFRQADGNEGVFVERNLIAAFWGAFGAYFFMAYFGSGVEGHIISNYTVFTLMGTIIGSQVPLLARPAKASVKK